MMRNKWVRIASIVVGVLLLAIIVRCGLIAIRYRAVKAGGSANWFITRQPFYSGEHSMRFLMDHDGEMDLTLWWDGVTGSVDTGITDEQGNECFRENASRIDRAFSVSLKEGTYELHLDTSGFSGAIAIGYDGIMTIRDLPDDRYALVPADPAKGFQWEYLLYVPQTVTHGYMLVVPNNTGHPTDNMDAHRESAKSLIIEKSGVANALGVPLLVPVFPRPGSHGELYTHALDRAALLTDIDGLKRIDLQLIAMIGDAKGVLEQKGVALNDQILMSGFSASADFTDRFTILHPELVKAAAIGGADSLPCETLGGENLPYPLGVYDCEAITGEPFDPDAFADVYRFLYMGSEDENGWETVEENGVTVTYTGKEYYERYELPRIMEDLSRRPSPIYTGGVLSDLDEKEIAHRVFDGKILADKLLDMKSIFEEMNLDRNEFKVYAGVGHTVTDEMRDDEIAFFQRVLAGE